jgi:hypothetical protein
MHGWVDGARAHAMKDVQGAEDILYLFFSPSPASQAKGVEFVTRIFTRTDDRDANPGLDVRDAQAAAIIEWGIRDPSKLDRLANITAPTLVANGDNDIMVPTVNSYLLAGHIPNATLRIYPDANHGFLFQYPQEFAAEVNAFLDQEPDRTPTDVLTGALERAATAHAVYEAQDLGGKHDDEWPRWYAEHMTRELAGNGHLLEATAGSTGA